MILHCGNSLKNPYFKKPHICSICGKGFKHKTILKKHVKSLHKEACYFCCKICEGDEDLKRHILEIHGKAHGGEKSQICTLCDKSFLWKNNLHMHIMKAHPGAKYLGFFSPLVPSK